MTKIINRINKTKNKTKTNIRIIQMKFKINRILLDKK